MARNQHPCHSLNQSGSTPFLYDVTTREFFTIQLPTPTPGYSIVSLLVNGLGDNGQLVGKYIEQNSAGQGSRTHFIATPEPELVAAKPKKPKKR